MKDIRAELEKILDDNISYGYEFQMSDYAVSNKEDDEYYQRGREEVKEATDQILELFKKIVPPEPDYYSWAEPYTGTDKPDGIVFGLAKQIEMHGYGRCRADILERLK